MSVRDAFADQVVHCESLGSPFMGQLMRLFSERLEAGDPVSDHILAWPGNPFSYADSVPLRVAGALHALRLDGLALGDVYPPNQVDDATLWDAVSDAMRTHSARVLRWLESAPQTNEVRRSAMIMPALALLHERYQCPVALYELGASGGLNLRPDQFRFETEAGALGPENSTVRLTPEWRGEPFSGALPEVVRRAGVDLNPLDPANPEHELRLLAYLWPDQVDRVARTQAAIDLARRTPAELAAGDAAGWLEQQLASHDPGAMAVVFHTIAWQYFPEATKTRAEAALQAAGARASSDAPFAHLSVEADGGKGAAIVLRTWPGERVEALGRADFHGRWVAWSPTEV